MTDLISRAALFNSISTAQDKADIFAAIQNAPAVDAVVHGHWISIFNDVECSVCKRFPSESKRYCPNCGAKMDEVVE